MDTRTGERYPSIEKALEAGVPKSKVAEIVGGTVHRPHVKFASGPFKNRVYERLPSGHLRRVK